MEPAALAEPSELTWDWDELRQRLRARPAPPPRRLPRGRGRDPGGARPGVAEPPQVPPRRMRRRPGCAGSRTTRGSGWRRGPTSVASRRRSEDERPAAGCLEEQVLSRLSVEQILGRLSGPSASSCGSVTSRIWPMGPSPTGSAFPRRPLGSASTGCENASETSLWTELEIDHRHQRPAAGEGAGPPGARSDPQLPGGSGGEPEQAGRGARGAAGHRELPRAHPGRPGPDRARGQKAAARSDRALLPGAGPDAHLGGRLGEGPDRRQGGARPGDPGRGLPLRRRGGGGWRLQPRRLASGAPAADARRARLEGDGRGRPGAVGTRQADRGRQRDPAPRGQRRRAYEAALVLMYFERPAAARREPDAGGKATAGPARRSSRRPHTEPQRITT